MASESAYVTEEYVNNVLILPYSSKLNPTCLYIRAIYICNERYDLFNDRVVIKFVQVLNCRLLKG